jgi:tetratricopeptide (TPR) repeat protein
LSRANARFVAGDLAGCTDICEEILARDPNHGGAAHLIGRLATRAGNPELAVSYFRQAAAAEPTETRHLFALAAALRQLNRNAEAIAALRTTLTLNPDFHAAHYNLANALKDEGDVAAALPHYQAAVEIAPNNADYLGNLAAAHRALEQMDEALRTIDLAIAVKPSDGILRWNRAQILVMKGDYAAGWDAFPARFDTGPNAFRRRHQNCPEWTGETLTDGTLLLWGDQGLGDEMILGSLIAEAAALAPHIVVECEPRLAPLFARSLPKIEVIPRNSPAADRSTDPAITTQMAFSDLPRLFRRNASDFSPVPGYLTPNPESIAAIRQRLAIDDDRFRVGISWESANPIYKPLVDIPLPLWDSVLQVDGVEFVSVQYGDQPGALREAQERTGTAIHVDPDVEAWSDLEGAAAQLAGLDLVIAASNSVGCLAAAVGVPTWQLLPTSPEFYWGLSSEQCLWFTNMRLIRQARPGDWGEMMGRVAADLAGWVATNSAP